MRKLTGTISLLLMFLLIISLQARAHTWYVPGDAVSIQAALNLTQPRDSVIVAAGTYLEHDILVPDGVVLRSETGLPDCVTIDARGLGRVLEIDGGFHGVAVEGFTIQGGDGVDHGGGIHVVDNTFLRDLVVRSNRAAVNGGGIYANTVWMNRVTCTGNRAGEHGGGIYVEHMQGEYPDFPWWHDILLTGNLADLGSGLTVIECANWFHISGLTVTGNLTPLDVDGSAIHIYTCEACLVQFPAIFDAIVAFNQGYGLTLDDADYSHHISFSGHDPILSSSDVFGNELGGYGGTFFDLTDWFGNLSTDPLFCDPGTGDFHLRPGSPCLPQGNFSRTLMGAFGAGCQPTAVPEQPASAAARMVTLHQNHPNPANPTTTIGFDLATTERVWLEIYDISGRLVRVLIDDEPRGPGEHLIRWDGVDRGGRTLPSGVYPYRLTAGKVSVTKRLTLLK